MSPFIHRRLFAAAGREADYSARQIPPEQLPAVLPDLLEHAAGINVTIPYKQDVIPFMTALRGRAELYRSVNTIHVRPEGIYGYNTDADGFLCALEGGHVPLQGRVVILGCGGVGRTFACEAALAGCEIVNAVRAGSLPHAEELQRFVAAIAPSAPYRLTTLEALDEEAQLIDLLINATPVGMYPHSDGMPVSDRVLARTAAVFDSVYNPADTRLLQRARAHGAVTVGGMPMLVWQAAAAHTLWYGAQFDRPIIDRLIEDADAEMKRHFGG